MAASPSSAIEVLARLVSFNTVSRNSNLELVGFVKALLDAQDVAYRLSFDPTGQKANLHAIVGPVQPGGLAFSGHVDTVSADGQTWTGDPFTLRRQNGKLIGRGACDMKGFIASVLAAVPRIRSRSLTRPVHLLLTYDEEVGYHGARRLLEDIEQSGLRPAACVVGEATGMMPVLAQKGRVLLRVEVRGQATHSSKAHKGVNAVHAVAEAAAWLAAEARRLAREGPTEAGFDPPYSTLQVCDVKCDVLPNTVPGRAGFDVECRNIPADDPKHALARFRRHVQTAIEPWMHALHPDTGFTYQMLLELPGLSLPPQHQLARAVCEIAGVPTGAKASYCSEGSLYQSAGITSVVCGPGDVAQAHQTDEWISETQLVACEDFIHRMVDRLAV